jgi:hypothetical protein
MPVTNSKKDVSAQNGTAAALAEIAVEMRNQAPVGNETDQQIAERLEERFTVLDILVEASITGDARALIVSGPPGVGKSFTVEQHMREYDPAGDVHTIIKGFVRASGLFKTLYNYRHPGNVIIFDDADSVFFDDNSLNIIKSVCDTTGTRRVSWLSEYEFIDAEGEAIPNTFEFEATVIFITNLDFDFLVDRNHRLAESLKALMSRAHYLDMSMKTRRDYLVRIKTVVEAGLLGDFSVQERSEIMGFIEANYLKIRELSLRMAIKVGHLRKSSPSNWKRIALLTTCKA